MRQLRRAMRPVTPVIQAATQARWLSFVSTLPADTRHFVEVKWQLPPSWHGGNPPRPRSAEEVATLLGTSAEIARDVDWGLIEVFRRMRRHYRLFWTFLTTPIDAAQDWWDVRFQWLHYPDGSRKPQGQEGPAPKTPPEADDRHEIEDRDELLRHVLDTHGLEYALEEPRLAHIDHNIAHDDEAQDREWDKRFRPGR